MAMKNNSISAHRTPAQSGSGTVRMLAAAAAGLGLLAAGPASALLPFKNDGNLYVAMWTANKYNIFTKDGELRGSITAPGLDGPRGVAFNPHNGDIWVAGEHSNTYHIFDRWHRLKKTITHPDFLEPLAATFQMRPGVKDEDQEVYISNSGNAAIDLNKGNNIMVFDQAGNFLRSFTRDGLVDPNCTATFPDGSLYVSNRLGSVNDDGVVDGILGRIDKFDANDNFLFSFTTPGIFSLMAVARDPNGPGRHDDTIWVTSGGGDRGIYEFDQNGNLLKSILPADLEALGVPNARVVPQGIAFDDEGNMSVASNGNLVLQFDGDGNLRNWYETGDGTARSIGFQYLPKNKGQVKKWFDDPDAE